MSGKRKAEGIALLSMYNDEEEEEEEEGDDEDVEDNMDVDNVQDENLNGDGSEAEVQEGVAQEEEQLPVPEDSPPIPALASPPPVSPLVPEQELSASAQPTATAGSLPALAASPLLQVLDAGATGSVGIGIVDYAQDDANMSPEPEEGEITTRGRAIVVLESRVETSVASKEVQLDTSLDFSLEKVSSPEHDSHPEESTLRDDVGANNEQASQEPSCEENGSITLEAKLIDPLLEFLPPPPSTICSEELQMKFTKFLQMKNQGRSFNKDLRNSKGYRNPDFLQRAVRYQEIDQLGSCFKKEVFDPYGYDPADFYDALVAQQRREIEKKEQERKQSQRVDFVRAGVQTAQVVAADARTKPVAPSVVPQKSGISSNTTTTVIPTSISTDASGKADARTSKKSKWDKVETNGKPLPTVPSGAQHAIAAASAHVALMSGAGAGYASFAQKRREAEGKIKAAAKLSGFSGKPDKKFDKS